MLYTLENEILKVTISDHGAELRSVVNKKTGMEYMWQADKLYWGRTAPILFPFVGAVRDNQYSYDHTFYTMNQHGFARDMDFTLGEREDCKIWFTLEDQETTYVNYPFHFKLYIGYELKQDKVKVFCRVENKQDTDMFFSIGAHPAFNCPIYGEDSKEGYQILFDGDMQKIYYHGLNKEGLSVSDIKTLALEEGKYVLSDEIFDESALIIEKQAINGVTLADPDGNPIVKVVFNTPLFALWSPEKKKAPFVCIEPWHGRCDSNDFKGELRNRAYEQTLKAHGTFANVYEMKFFEVPQKVADKNQKEKADEV